MKEVWWRKEPYSRWESNIEIEFIGKGGDGVDWINMAGDGKVAYSFEHCNETLVPYKAGYLLTGEEILNCQG